MTRTKSAAPGSRRWLIPATTFALLVLGTIAITTALTLWLTQDDDGDRSAASPGVSFGTRTPTSAPSIGSIPSVDGTTGNGPVSELADPAWVTRTAVATGIPERALTAYAGAAISANAAKPECGIGWNTLAAIGLVESEHAGLDKARLADDGTVAPPIIGVALDGDGVAKVADTDSGKLDDDPTWDHAVGPMQFLPATWAEHAADGNGDGTPDIHNLDDAALTAALYLCSSGGDLTQPDNWIAAVSAYNTGAAYNTRVAEAATAYATAAEAL